MAFLRSSVTPFMSAHLNYPKKEATIFDITISSTSSPHNCIESGTNLFAFQATADPGRLAVLPLDAKGRTSFNQLGHIFIANLPLTDFKFLKYPAENDILVATTRAGNVKLFTLKNIFDGDSRSINSPDSQFNTTLGAVESLASHKSISNFFVVGGDHGWAAFDAEDSSQEVCGGKVAGPIKALDWSTDGNQIAVLQTVEKTRKGTAIDPRSTEVILEYDAHNSFGRECRIIHGGKYIISSGFNDSRFQEIVVYDTVAGKVFIRQQYDKSISFLIPAYDEDSKLLFLGAKGSTLFRHIDVTNMDVASPNQLNCPSQTIGFCLSPKIKCDVMSAQVQKVYQLHQNGIAPIPCNVIRRTYSEFHSELYPDTAGLESGGTVAEWKAGADKPVKRINLRPVDAPTMGIVGTNAAGKPSKEYKESKVEALPPQSSVVKSPPTNGVSKDATQKVEEKVESKNVFSAPTPIIRKTISNPAENASVKLREAPPPRPPSNIASQVASRLYESRSPYYNIKAVPAKSKTITDVRDINSRISPDGVFFTVSGKYAALAMSKTEGSVAIFDLNTSGRTPDGSLDAIFNRAPIMDLQFDPFNDARILCALSSGLIKVWDISEAEYCTNRVPPKAALEPGMRNVISEDDNKYSTLSKLTPTIEIKCQIPKIAITRFNPVVANVVAVAGSNGTLLVINLETGAELFNANYHKTAIVSLSWSQDGTRLITADRDNNFILTDIRKGDDGIITQTNFKAKSPRAIFTGTLSNNEYIFVTYIEGTLHKWVLMDLDLKPMKEENLGSSQGSQSLRPLLDYDSGIVFMASKGSPNIFMSQITPDGFVADILQTTLMGPHQAIALMPKKVVDTATIEIVRIIRLTNNSIEIIPMVVPRREKNLFFRELYPNALVTWEPSLPLDDWLAFKAPHFKYVDLKPDDMTELPCETRLSQPQAPIEKSITPPKQETKENASISSNPVVNPFNDTKKKTEAEVIHGWSKAIPMDTEAKLPQDDVQGVDMDEWEEINVEEHM